MLRIGRDLHAPDRDEEPGPGRRRGAELRGQRPAPPRGAVRRLWIQPAAGDAGGALGAALFVWHQLLGQPRDGRPARLASRGASSAPSSTPDEIEPLPRRRRGRRRAGSTTRPSCCEHVAGLLADGKVVGWFQGRMEFGPRALGARSILGDPRSPRMQATMNLKIKFRESFRPFAPCVLAEHAHEWFDLEPGQESPYMLLVAPVPRASTASRSTPSSRGSMERRPRPPPPGQRRPLGRSRPSPTSTTAPASRRSTTTRNPRLHACCRPSTAGPAARCWSTRASTSAASRSSAPPRTPTAASCATDMDALVLEDTVLLKDERGPRGRRRGPRGIPGPVPARLTDRGPTSCDGPTSPSRPAPRMLRQFAGLWLAFFGGLAGLAGARAGPASASAAALAVAGGRRSAASAWSGPALVRPIFVGWMVLAFPIGWAVSLVLLGLVYYGLFTPIGLVFRLVGRDALQLRPPARRDDLLDPAAGPGRRPPLLPPVLRPTRDDAMAAPRQRVREAPPPSTRTRASSPSSSTSSPTTRSGGCCRSSRSCCCWAS